MLTSARIETLASVEGVQWISALRAPQIQALVKAGSLQLSLFDKRNLVEILDPAYPGERLMVCKNPLLAAERKRKREDLLAATEAKLAPLRERVASGKLRGKDAIGLAVGKLIDRHKVGKHFLLEIGEDSLKLRSSASRNRSRPRRPWTGSTCCVPRPVQSSWTALRWCVPTSSW